MDGFKKNNVPIPAVTSEPHTKEEWKDITSEQAFRLISFGQRYGLKFTQLCMYKAVYRKNIMKITLCCYGN